MLTEVLRARDHGLMAKHKHHEDDRRQPGYAKHVYGGLWGGYWGAGGCGNCGYAASNSVVCDNCGAVAAPAGGDAAAGGAPA